jgi:predicted amidophosphoribosyltransferase
MHLHVVLRALARLPDLAWGGRCAGCGRPGYRTPCHACRLVLARAPRVVGAGWHHSGAAARLVLAAKHGTWRAGGRVLARLLVRTGRVGRGDVHAVTFVPADRRRRARRGGCLPERAARELARELGVPCVGLLVRSRASPSQRDRARVDRLRNARTAFAVRAGRAAPPAGARVLLVDDVRTTGATLDACASLLAAAGLRPAPLAIVAAGTVAREERVPAVSSRTDEPLRESRNERGIPAHDGSSHCRYGGSRRVKRSSRP